VPVFRLALFQNLADQAALDSEGHSLLRVFQVIFTFA
jgi:hypothetical protein